MSRPAEDAFARAALQCGCSFSAGLAEARALMAKGRPEDAERILASLTPPTNIARLTLTLVRARNLFWALDRATDAETVVREGERALLASAHHGPALAELHAMRARFAFAQGRPRVALAMAARVEGDERAPAAARVRAAVAMAEALAVCGRRDDAVAVARRWEPAAQRHLAAAQALAHWLAGSLYEATYEADRAYAAASDPQGWAVAALLLGHVWLSRGDTDAALRWFRESSVLLRGADPIGMRPAALAGIAQAAAHAGDAVHAASAIAELDRMPHAGRGVGEELGLARAWAAHVCGNRERAVALATEVVALAEARGADGFATRARAELTRLAKY